MYKYVIGYIVGIVVALCVGSLAAKAEGGQPRFPSPITEVNLVEGETAYLVGEIDGRLVLPVIRMIASYTKPAITIVIDSYGGSVGAGMALIQVMRAAQARGLRIDCVVTGNAMSMGVLILAACNNRYVLKDSLLLWHAVRVMYQGPLTGQGAAILARDLLEFELPLLVALRRQVNLPHNDFMYYWANEAIHHGSELARKTSFVSVVETVRGAPLVQLFQTAKPPSFQDFKRSTTRPFYIWIAPRSITNPK